MNRRQEIINQIVFILVIVFIIFLLWGYGAGWFGASADINAPPENRGFLGGISGGVKKLYNLPIFQDERNLHWAL